MTRFVYKVGTSIDPEACPVILIEADRQDPVLNLLDEARPKTLAHRTISMVAKVSKSIINKDAQTPCLGACCVRPQRTDPSRGDARRVARSRHTARSIAFGGSARLDHKRIDSRNPNRVGADLRPPGQSGRGHRDHPDLQSIDRYAGRHAIQLKGCV